MWSPNAGLSYRDHLVLWSQEDIARRATAERGAQVDRQTRLLVASNEELAATCVKGYDRASERIEWGLDRVESQLGDVVAGVDRVENSLSLLRADFAIGVTAIVATVERSNALLSDVVDRLDKIHQVLSSPTLTQAREHYRIGTDRVRRGFLMKAVESFHAAEALNELDVFVQLSLATVHLFGANEDESVLDLDLALKHALLAARCAKSEIASDARFGAVAQQALFIASYSRYVAAARSEGAPEPKLLGESLSLVDRALAAGAEEAELRFHRCRCLALLGRADTFQEQATSLFSDSAVHATKALAEPSFQIVAQNLTAALAMARASWKARYETDLAALEKEVEVLATRTIAGRQGFSASRLGLLTQAKSSASTGSLVGFAIAGGLLRRASNELDAVRQGVVGVLQAQARAMLDRAKAEDTSGGWEQNGGSAATRDLRGEIKRVAGLVDTATLTYLRDSYTSRLRADGPSPQLQRNLNFVQSGFERFHERTRDASALADLEAELAACADLIPRFEVSLDADAREVACAARDKAELERMEKAAAEGVRRGAELKRNVGWFLVAVLGCGGAGAAIGQTDGHPFVGAVVALAFLGLMNLIEGGPRR